MTISPGVVLSGGEKGDVDIHVKQITLLSASSNVATAVSGGVADSGSENNAGAKPSIAQYLSALLQRSSSLDIAFATERFVYLARDAKTGNVRYEITDLSLSSKDQSIQLSALIDVQGQPQRSVSAAFSSIDMTSELSSNRTLRGELSADVSSAAIDSSDSKSSRKIEFTHSISTPVEITDNLIDLTTIEYRSPVSWVRGALGVDMNTDRLHILADLEVRKLQLSLAANRNDQPGGRSKPRIFPFKPFAFRISEHIDAQVDMHLGAIRLDATPIINGRV